MHHAQLGGQRRQRGDARVLAPGMGRREPALLLGDAEIGALEQLRRQDHLGALGRRPRGPARRCGRCWRPGPSPIGRLDRRRRSACGSSGGLLLGDAVEGPAAGQDRAATAGRSPGGRGTGCSSAWTAKAPGCVGVDGHDHRAGWRSGSSCGWPAPALPSVVRRSSRARGCASPVSWRPGRVGHAAPAGARRRHRPRRSGSPRPQATGQATTPGATKRARLSTWPSVWSLSRPSPSHSTFLRAQRLGQRGLGVGLGPAGVAVGVEQALAGGQHRALAVVVDARRPPG